MKNNDFINKLKELKIDFDDAKIQKLYDYLDYLMEYNKTTNLTAIRNRDEILLKHFLDSLMVTTVIELTPKMKVLDIGTGAGFPGIVLKIFYPEIDITLLDSNNKKTTFLKNCVDKLNLEKLAVINMRAEDYMDGNLNKFDLCVSRAVAHTGIISQLSLPFIKKDGTVVLMKGSYEDELLFLEKNYKNMGISSYKIDNYQLEGLDQNRSLISLKKELETKTKLSYNQVLNNYKRWNK